MTHPLISATFIYDGTAAPIIPAQLMPHGMSKEDGLAAIEKCGQFQGSSLEVLCEIAARSCYDSAGRGRSSPDMHKHILEVGHLSVLEHAVFTVRWECNAVTIRSWALEFLNKPNVDVRWGCGPENSDLAQLFPTYATDRWFMEVTLNLRHVLEWAQYPSGPFPNTALPRVLKYVAHQLAPTIVGPSDPLAEDEVRFRLIDPRDDRQKWATYLLTGSRGFSHELVRHGDWTAISQRSTRYVDESESPWVEHPLTDAFFQDGCSAVESLARACKRRADIQIKKPGSQEGRFCADPATMEWEAKGHAQGCYKVLVSELEPWLISKGIDKFSARKQARGAARGYLGNALYTEVVFSASINQWMHMIRMRACAAADAEIREVFVAVFKDMAVRYAERFAGWTVQPAADGIGEVVVPA